MHFPNNIREHVLAHMTRYDVLSGDKSQLSSMRDEIERKFKAAIKSRDQCQLAWGGQVMAAHISITVSGLAHDLKVVDEQLEQKIAEQEGIRIGVESLLLGHLYESSSDFQASVESIRDMKELIDHNKQLCDDFLVLVGIGLRQVTNSQYGVPIMGQAYMAITDESKITGGLNIINKVVDLFNYGFAYHLIEEPEEEEGIIDRTNRISRIAMHHRLNPIDYVHAAQKSGFAIREEVQRYQAALQYLWEGLQVGREKLVSDAIKACSRSTPYRS